MFCKVVFLLSVCCLSCATTPTTSASVTEELPVKIVALVNDVQSTEQKIEGVQIKSICDEDDPASIIETTDECIVDPIMRESISQCRVVSYGSAVPKEAATKFCSGAPDARAEMDELFDICLRNQGLNQEAIQVEFVANCGFCSNIELANKTEECFVSIHVLLIGFR
jgi:hypothetical protein